MENYFELQLPDGALFKGMLSPDRSCFSGPAVLVRKDRSVMIGTTVNSEFDGFGAFADLQENSIYLGGFSKSEKHGYGKNVKYRVNTEIRPLMAAGFNCTRDNFFDTVDTWVAKAKQAETLAEEKSYQTQMKFTQDADLKVILKKVKTTLEQSKAKKKKRAEKIQKIWCQYTGSWKNGRREGWGVCSYKSNDVYKGSFQGDRMHGRGQYWYSDYASCLLYIGEFYENTFQGLGKMIFADGSTYYGSFSNNMMSSQRAVINFANGDKFKGQIDGNEKTGLGEYWFAPEDKNILHYEGEFKYDKRHGDGKLTCTTEKTTVVYSGNFDEDKRSGRCDELAVGSNKDVVFKGQMNNQEQMDCAYGTIEIDTAFVTALDDPSAVESSNMKYKKLQGKVIYSGGFEANRFHGKGTLEYANGTRFQGEFLNHCKEGPASFKLKNGRIYYGQFRLNTADPKFDNFGPRF